MTTLKAVLRQLTEKKGSALPPMPPPENINGKRSTLNWGTEGSGDSGTASTPARTSKNLSDYYDLTLRADDKGEQTPVVPIGRAAYPMLGYNLQLIFKEDLERLFPAPLFDGHFEINEIKSEYPSVPDTWIDFDDWLSGYPHNLPPAKWTVEFLNSKRAEVTEHFESVFLWLSERFIENNRKIIFRFKTDGGVTSGGGWGGPSPVDIVRHGRIYPGLPQTTKIETENGYKWHMRHPGRSGGYYGIFKTRPQKGCYFEDDTGKVDFDQDRYQSYPGSGNDCEKFWFFSDTFALSPKYHVYQISLWVSIDPDLDIEEVNAQLDEYDGDFRVEVNGRNYSLSHLIQEMKEKRNSQDISDWPIGGSHQSAVYSSPKSTIEARDGIPGSDMYVTSSTLEFMCCDIPNFIRLARLYVAAQWRQSFEAILQIKVEDA